MRPGPARYATGCRAEEANGHFGEAEILQFSKAQDGQLFRQFGRIEMAKEGFAGGCYACGRRCEIRAALGRKGLRRLAIVEHNLGRRHARNEAKGRVNRFASQIGYDAKPQEGGLVWPEPSCGEPVRQAPALEGIGVGLFSSPPTRWPNSVPSRRF